MSWYAYKRVGPEEIIKLEIIKQELEMGEEQLPPAVDILLQLVQPEGTPIEKTRQALAQVSAINAYVPRFLEGTPKSPKLEYAACPNWSALQRLGNEDYLSIDGAPAGVSRIHGCTRVHEIYFRQIEPGVETAHFEPRPEKYPTCILEASIPRGPGNDRLQPEVHGLHPAVLVDMFDIDGRAFPPAG